MIPRIALVLLISVSCAWGQKRLTIEAICGASKFSPRTLGQVQWIPHTPAFTHFKSDSASGRVMIERIDAESGASSILIDSDAFPDLEPPRREKRFALPSYHWAPDGRSVLLPNTHDLVLIRLPEKTRVRLTDDQAEERDPAFSPDGETIAYLKNGNLHVFDLRRNREIPLTRHGTDALLIGRFDWVYEEEFHIRTGFAWSPDSRSIAFFELDTSPEPPTPIVDFLPLENTVTHIKYPKAGQPNAVVRIGVASLSSKKTVWMDTGGEPDSYIPRIHWLPDGRGLLIQRLNRLQNRLDLLLADARTGESRVILTEKDESGWVDFPEDILFLERTDRFLWLSERSGWSHLYLCGMDGNPVRVLTSGAWNVTEVEHIDETGGWVYFTATEAGPLERQLYRVPLNGGPAQRISSGPGAHSVQFSECGRYYLDVFSNVATPPRTSLHRPDGSLVRVVESGEIPELNGYALSPPEFLILKTDDGLRLNAFLMKPADFDPSRKYPVLVTTYGCPGTQVVRNAWSHGLGDLYHQFLLQNGFLVFGLDNRGMAQMGNDFKNLAYRDLSSGLEDQILGVRYLKNLPFVDSTRVGIWGWSGGGWMTCLAMTKGAGHFKAGAAVAPLTDLRNYDTIWMERYMGLPDGNPEGYAACNVLEHAGDLQGSLLLIHGAVDDNVHFANTMQLVHALQEAGKSFDLMVYPDKKHSIRGEKARIHLYKKMTDFFLKNL